MDDKNSLFSAENFEKFEKDISLRFNDNFDYSEMAKMAQNSVLQSKREIEKNARILAEMNIAKMNVEEEYKNNVLNTLISIEKNTASLTNLVDLIKNSNENQEKILCIINELLSLSKEKDKGKAGEKYKSVMKKITDLGENADTINKLYTFGTTIYSVLQASGIV